MNLVDTKRRVSNRRKALLESLERFKVPRFSSAEKVLVSRLTTLQEYHPLEQPNPRGELFIHWFYVDRVGNELTRCETFHLNMLKYFNVPDKVEVIHIRCAYRGDFLTSAMENTIKALSNGKASVDFKIVTPKSSWEHDTFKECVEYSVSTGKFVYYTHFKGVTRMDDSNAIDSRRILRRSSDLDILYWCYLMYRCLFTAPPNVKAIGPLAHKGMNPSYRNRDISWSNLCTGDEVFHYCGSFQAFSGKYIKESLEACNMSTQSCRNSKLWVGDPYCVEMFLSMVALKDDVYSLNVPYESTNNIYKVYQHHNIPEYEKDFLSMYDIPEGP